MFRVGSGFDIHRLVPGRTLRIGGVDIPSPFGFLGHSDGDILVHALCNALLGAAGYKDIGHYFSDTDLRWKNMDSLSIMLPQVFHMLCEKNFSIGNIDATLVLERPKISPYIDAMKQKLSEKLNCLDPSKISIKGTRTEQCFLTPPNEAGFAMVSVLLMESK
jgi:2-C-methyl-D-erythritol 2,4-cyclodiphosphate synthase